MDGSKGKEVIFITYTCLHVSIRDTSALCFVRFVSYALGEKLSESSVENISSTPGTTNVELSSTSLSLVSGQCRAVR